ncbi:MAG: hypothetical protein GXY83_12290 [Rhodopirellula sp.]|nr:hypothetical protein [Rhodopirellula sp.]
MPGQHTEYAFETAIEHHLTTAGGYVTGDRDGFDAHRAIFPADVLAFIRATQPDEWAYLEGIQKAKAEEMLLYDLCRALDSEHEGCLSVLRHGFKCFGKLFRVAYFAPASGMNPETKRRYEANRLSVTRQLRYSAKHGNTLDATLAVNGIPVATIELKNPMTAQTWRHAVTQYKIDLDSTQLADALAAGAPIIITTLQKFPFVTEKLGDQLFFESIREDAVADSGLRQAALANTMENFGYVFRKALEGLFIDRMDQNEEITAKFMNEERFRDAVSQHLLKDVYDHIRNEDAAEGIFR